jgi:peptidoglycan hydrolase-like protein with peptidoglycan-binding domain
LNWLIANVKEFGFSWEVVPSEPWHLRYVNGDNAPASVKAWMEKNGVSALAGGAPAPASGGDDIKKLQEALKAKGFYKGEINGQKDSATDEAIKAFKVANKLAADSVAGPKVKELLGL